MKVSKRKEKRRMELYERGLKDGDIAEKVGMTRAGIGSWRRSRRLPRNTPVGGMPSEADEKRTMDLYERGLKDGDIAEKLGTTRSRIGSWRRHRRLPRNTPAEGRISEAEQKRRMDLYERGLKDSEIAEKVGLGTSAIGAWRRGCELPRNVPQGSGLPEAEQKRRMELYERGLKDSEIAEKVGLTDDAISKWRIKNRLPKNNSPREKRKKERKDMGTIHVVNPKDPPGRSNGKARKERSRRRRWHQHIRGRGGIRCPWCNDRFANWRDFQRHAYTSLDRNHPDSKEEIQNQISAMRVRSLAKKVFALKKENKRLWDMMTAMCSDLDNRIISIEDSLAKTSSEDIVQDLALLSRNYHEIVIPSLQKLADWSKADIVGMDAVSELFKKEMAEIESSLTSLEHRFTRHIEEQMIEDLPSPAELAEKRRKEVEELRKAELIK